jgi:hypothetical protein
MLMSFAATPWVSVYVPRWNRASGDIYHSRPSGLEGEVSIPASVGPSSAPELFSGIALCCVTAAAFCPISKQEAGFGYKAKNPVVQGNSPPLFSIPLGATASAPDCVARGNTQSPQSESFPRGRTTRKGTAGPRPVVGLFLLLHNAGGRRKLPRRYPLRFREALREFRADVFVPRQRFL